MLRKLSATGADQGIRLWETNFTSDTNFPSEVMMGNMGVIHAVHKHTKKGTTTNLLP